ncbi:MAG: helix-turn-helix domain-containing protein, partial [Halanaerobiaceae bacterium]
ISELNIIQLKRILLEFSKKSSTYINELKESCNIINRVKQYINKYYYKNLKLKSIAERFYINPAYLGRLFKRETGKCFSHYLNEKRLQTAKNLLERTDLHVYQVARRVGYQNTDYFIIKFKKREQCTPMEYRRKSNDTEYN